MSPEQATGNSRSTASDVWGLGVVLYECAYGRRPFEANSLPALLASIVQEAPRFDPLPNALERVLAKALAKDPLNRFASMVEFESALLGRGSRLPKPAAASVAVTGSADSTPIPRAATASRWPLWLALIAINVALAIALLASGTRVAVGIACGLAGLAASLLIGWLLNRVDANSRRRSAHLDQGAGQLRRKADMSQVLSRSVAIAVETLLADSAGEPAIDLRKASLALAIDDFNHAKDRLDQRNALERAIVIADKLSDQLAQKARPWHARHKEALTLLAAVLSASAALLSSFAGAFK
jgi:uncharacterized membrane protein YraQ (UPF0718 family)